MSRKIIHCDCDCFYAAIEIRDDPALKRLPVAVGGSTEHRGVIATCNYEARKFGVRSAMSSAAAKRLCPDLIIISPNMEKYRLASTRIHGIFKDYTSIIEPLSLDEAFLDVTNAKACNNSATLIAAQIRQRVKDEIGITLSAGIAPNKFLAKIASDWNKPDGQFVITPDKVDAFVAALPVEKLFGVGKVTARKLRDLGIITCRDLQALSQRDLLANFGSFGENLYNLARGIDNREVKTQRQYKSISVEHTFSKDLPGLEQCLNELPPLLLQLERRIRRSKSRVMIAKQFVKLRFNDFMSTTVEQPANTLTLDSFRALCSTGFARGNRPVRLLGLGIRLKTSDQFSQLPLAFE